jgi:hypothetical protein
MAFFFFLFAMVKAIVPRYRYDQLMRIGWKVFLPLSLAWVVIVAFLAKFEVFGGAYARWAIGGLTMTQIDWTYTRADQVLPDPDAGHISC